jgi:hypothetical protein
VILAVCLEGADPSARDGFDLEAEGRALLMRVNPEELRGDWGQTPEAKTAAQNVMAQFGVGGGRP